MGHVIRIPTANAKVAKVRKGKLRTVDDSGDAVAKMDDVEVDQEAEMFVG
jgi:hypothetical protein